MVDSSANMRPEPWSPHELVTQLSRLGVCPGDILMVHASLRKIGPTEHGASGLLDALDMAIGTGGALLMVLGALIDHEWVNEHPEHERAALLAGAAPFDPLTARALPEVGYLAEAFRTRPGTVVTDNPCGRFGARGRHANELVEAAPWDDYYGPGSPLHRLCEAGGKVLRMGANADTTTVLHYAEYLASVPDKRRIRRHYRVRGPHGAETRAVECLDDEHGIVDFTPEDPHAQWPDTDYFAAVLKAYLAAGRGLRGRVGCADAELLDAADFVEFGARWMSDHLVPRRSDSAT